MREFYETSYANVHRGVYDARRARDRRLRGRAREGARVRERADARARSSSRAARPRRSTSSPTRGGSTTSARATSSSSPSSSTTRTSCPGSTSRSGPAPPSARIPIDDNGELQLDELDEIAAEGQRQGRRQQPRLELARDDQPGREARRLGARAGRDHGRRRRAGGAAPRRRRAGARLRLPRVLVAQALRAERRRRALGPQGAARGDAAVQPRRRDDPLGRARADDLERAAVQVRGRHACDRRGGTASASRSTTSRRSGIDAIERHEHELVVYAMDRLGEMPGVRVFGPPADRRAGIVSFDARGRPPARRRADPRLGGRRRPRGPPLHAAADDASRRRRDVRARASTSTRCRRRSTG